MATFDSKASINQPVGKVYEFLADFNNHQKLVPDNVQNWSSTYNEASFGIQNMVQLSLKVTERVDNKLVKIQAVGNPPFPVTLTWAFAEAGDTTIVTFSINAELNMMMKMMASGPLQKLANHEVEQLAALLNR